jgi:hypothetical protein
MTARAGQRSRLPAPTPPVSATFAFRPAMGGMGAGPGPELWPGRSQECNQLSILLASRRAQQGL